LRPLSGEFPSDPSGNVHIAGKVRLRKLRNHIALEGVCERQGLLVAHKLGEDCHGQLTGPGAACTPGEAVNSPVDYPRHEDGLQLNALEIDSTRLPLALEVSFHG
jgi:hypothetical protein